MLVWREKQCKPEKKNTATSKHSYVQWLFMSLFTFVWHNSRFSSSAESGTKNCEEMAKSFLISKMEIS